MKIEEYRELVNENIKLAVKVSDSTEKSEFVQYVAGILSGCEEFEDFIECEYYGGDSHNGYMAVDGYAKDESDGSICIILSDYRDDSDNMSFLAKDMETTYKKMRIFVETAVKSELYRQIYTSSQAKELARDLYYDNENITKFRFYIITNSVNKMQSKNIKDKSILGKSVEVNVWDIERLFDLVCSSAQKESVEIELDDFGIDGIPCVKAVAYSDVIADIDIVGNDEEKDKNKISYSSYLAVFPGNILSKLYIEYGSKLLEGNVRSFLSTKKTVNRNMQSTIKNYPEMFFAYNNGIAATATEIETKLTENGLIITRIKDLQIVNGGQTTACIANSILTAKKGETVNLDSLFVPMKLSVLEHSMAEVIIPKISEYSNSQNKVEASDFFSNHQFHIRMEELSRKTSIPSKNGMQMQQYWFYERTRGQYNQGKMCLQGASDVKKYSDKYPEKMIVTSTDMAKYMELYDGRPDIVSKGKQKLLQDFATKIKANWDKMNADYNAFYYKKAIAIAIIYKKADELIKQTAWYKEKHSYKANVIAYTLSIIFDYIRRNEAGYDIDFMKIWNMQDTYAELDEQINVLAKEVYVFITGSRPIENVTEWCKREECWTKAKGYAWSVQDQFIATLVSKEEQKQEVREEKKTQKMVNEYNVFNQIWDRGQQYWKQVLEWGKTRRLLTEKEISLLQLTVNMFQTYRPLKDKDAKYVMDTRKKLIDAGMPYQF